jgi:MoaA/NifB/PqqE/SkfB family radical SAM enzyme
MRKDSVKMIRIVNWLLTRRCNLNCDYCAIVKDYHEKPPEYPDMKHYIKNEMDTATVINSLLKFRHHNPNCFHIFYGGEPLLRKDLAEILKICNRHGIHYTVISNNTEEIQPLIKKLIDEVNEIKGFTASIDPILVDEQTQLSHRLKKSQQGFEFLLKMKEICKDVVAEVTVLREDQHLIYKLVEKLSSYGINSDITFVDIAKNQYYDFSNISSESSLVQRSPELAYQLMEILADDSLDIHMKNYLLPETYKILPSNMDCKIEDDLHNVTIDADGSVRLCLRIRGIYTPSYCNVLDLIDSEGKINNVVHNLIKEDKFQFCQLCNHTCQLMSKYINDLNLGPDSLVHLDRR